MNEGIEAVSKVQRAVERLFVDLLGCVDTIKDRNEWNEETRGGGWEEWWKKRSSRVINNSGEGSHREADNAVDGSPTVRAILQKLHAPSGFTWEGRTWTSCTEWIVQLFADDVIYHGWDLLGEETDHKVVSGRCILCDSPRMDAIGLGGALQSEYVAAYWEAEQQWDAYVRHLELAPLDPDVEFSDFFPAKKWKPKFQAEGYSTSDRNWPRIWKRFGGEKHPHSGPRELRFPICELNRAGVTPPST